LSAYYNEFKPEAAAMLRQLIRDGLIAAGEVDERSITEVQADDIRNYTQCHFFAGIGGWSVALRLAGWDDTRPVWTGSCPCQPFSSAGRQKGKADERHLWPVWFRLIRESKPAFVFGEQVSAAIRHGWWDDVADDLEGEGYSTRAEIRPASSVGRPHKRDRLWFVANAQSEQTIASEPRGFQPEPTSPSDGGSTLGNSQHDGQSAGQVGGSEGQAIQHDTGGEDCASEFEGAGQSCDVADSELRRCERQQEQQSAGLLHTLDGTGETQQPVGAYGTEPLADTQCGRRQGQGAAGESVHTAQGGDGEASESFDDSAGVEWIACPDGKSRPVKSGLCLLAHGYKHRTPILHAIGNAIVPSVAAAFIKATM
jgi:DNA (cytosine-5)-methyltransferase 1